MFLPAVERGDAGDGVGGDQNQEDVEGGGWRGRGCPAEAAGGHGQAFSHYT